MSDLADALYGGGAPAPSNPGTPNDLGASEDHASILYGGNGSPAPRPEWDKAAEAEAVMRLSRRVEEAKEEDPASALYGDNNGEFDGTDFSSAMESFAVDALKDGDAERSDALEHARQGLMADFKASGTNGTDAAEAIGIVNAYAYSLPDAETMAATETKTTQTLSAEWGDQFQTNLSAARQFINDLDRVSPGLKHSLERSGAGNDEKLVRLVVKEAKRRGYL